MSFQIIHIFPLFVEPYFPSEVASPQYLICYIGEVEILNVVGVNIREYYCLTITYSIQLKYQMSTYSVGISVTNLLYLILSVVVGRESFM